MPVGKRDLSSFTGEVSRRDGYKKSLAAGSSPSIDPAERRFPSAASAELRKMPIFSSYLDLPGLPLKIKQLCQIIANTPTSRVERALDESGHMVSHEDVEEVLKLSYEFPAAAVKFFRWAGRQLDNRHSPYSWNLIVDMLGKNRLFDAMWDSVKTMRREGISSLATFASVFSSYALADRVNEAIMAFEVLDQYGVLQDVMSLNSLLSAICRDGQTSKADEFLEKVMDRIQPDADSYAILLEGWENEGNVIKARTTFGAMISQIGWDPFNVPAYDSFLTLLVKDSLIHEAVRSLNVMRNNNCLPGLKFFKTALDVLSNKGDLRAALPIWKIMVGSRIMPDVAMYNSMIGLLCHSDEMELAFRFFDEMMYHGAYPDSETYNILFQTLVKNRKVCDATCIFHEMVKNESHFSSHNCEIGIKFFLDEARPDVAINIWKHVVHWNIIIKDESANSLISGLRKQSRLPEACKYAEEMLERGVSLSSKELSRLKHSLSKVPLGITIAWACAFFLTKAGVYSYKGCDVNTPISNIASVSCRKHVPRLKNCRVDTSHALKTSPWFRIFRFPYPFQWGTPVFHWKMAPVMCAVSIIASVDSVSRLQEQLQAERDLRAALEAGLSVFWAA